MKIFLLLILTFIMAACGQPHTSETKKRIKISESDLIMALNTQNIICPSEGCPEGVGRLFSLNFDSADDSHMCSTYLVGPNLAMTNSHCAWVNGLNAAKTCEGMYFVFPNQNGTYEQARCSKILFRNEKNHGTRYRQGDNDFALIELDQALAVPFLKRNKNPLRKGSMVHPIVVDMKNAVEARFIKLSCRVSSVDSFGVAKLSECPVISGNSGSPILDDTNTAVGIVFGSDNIKVRKTGTVSTLKPYKNTAYAFTMNFMEKFLKSFFN